MKVLLLGAGKIGAAIVEMLQTSGDYDILVGDRDDQMFDAVKARGVAYLEQQGVSVVFGIPGVHTVELYRGFARSRKSLGDDS